MAKARPDKVTRENMFFIESSSPSDGEAALNSVSSQNSEFSAATKHASLCTTNGASSGRSSSLFKTTPVSVEKKMESSSQNLKSVTETLSEEDTDEDEEFDDEDDEIDEDDEEDGDSAWDSLDDESETESFDDGSAFVRDDDKPRPLVRPSLLSSLFLNSPEKLQEERNNRANAAAAASKMNSAPVLDRPTSALTSPLKSTAAAPAPAPAPVPALAAAKPDVVPATEPMSPRTARRKMLVSELSESVRRDLLWDRKQVGVLKPSAAGASAASSSKVQKKIARRHTVGTSQPVSDEDEDGSMPLPGESWVQDLENEANGYFNSNTSVW